LAPALLRGCHPTSPAGAKAVPMLASTGQHNHPRTKNRRAGLAPDAAAQRR
jgi:hypothetical protein